VAVTSDEALSVAGELLRAAAAKLKGKAKP
jgi:hypothetical protein